MKIQFDCIPCMYRQVLEASRMITDDREIIRDIMNRYAGLVPEIGDESMAPLITAEIQKYIKEKTGVDDPYQEFKEKNIKEARKLYPEVKKVVEQADDSLQAALIMSAMGNSIDAGVSLNVDIKGNIKNAVDNGFVYSDYSEFKSELETARDLLIVADNAGEAVFDRLLLEELNKTGLEIYYAVREVPILNDVTKKEAKELGIDEMATLISSGCPAPGMVMDKASEEFRNIYDGSDMIISKGQGNLEGLSDEEENIYFLLKAKCDLVADLLGVEKGNFVFIRD